MMRNLLLLSAVSLPVVALANTEPLDGESNDVVVTFSNKSHIFEGENFVFEQPLVDRDSLPVSASLRLSVNVSTEMNFTMDAISSVDWPSVLTNTWDHSERQGTVDFMNKAVFDISIHGSVTIGSSTYSLSYSLFNESTEWFTDASFSSLLLEGTRQGPTVSLDSIGSSLFSIEQEVPIDALGISIELEGTISPITRINLTASEIEVLSNGTVSSVSESIALSPTTRQAGHTDVRARWHGMLDGEMGIRANLKATAKSGGGSFGPLNFPYDFMIFDDEIKVESDIADFRHDLPAIRSNTEYIDFGQVTIGDSEVVSVELSNLGNVELYGDATVEGDGFIMADYSLLLARTNNGLPTRDSFEVSFLPTEPGTFDGLLLVHTNDPINPLLSIPMVGVGVDPADPGGDPNDPGNGSGLVTQEGRGCGCSSVSPSGGLGALALLGLVGLIARRRRR